MRHRVAGRKLGRTSAHRQALMRNLSMALIEHERITTTLAKAKELRRFAERLVTLAKRETLHSRRRVLRHVPDRKLVAKLFDTLSARYAQRPGGYTRIIKLGPRRGDDAEMAVIELVDAEVAGDAVETKSDKSGKDASESGGRKSKTRAKAAAPEAAPKKAKGKKKRKAKKGAATPAAPKRNRGTKPRAPKATQKKIGRASRSKD